MLRLVVAILGGLSVTFALLVFMASVIAFQHVDIEKSKTPSLDISIAKPSVVTEFKARRAPSKPSPLVVPPRPSAERVQSQRRPRSGPFVDGLKIVNVSPSSGSDSIAIGELPKASSSEPNAGGSAVSADTDAIPIATLPPRYPHDALQQGVEGVVCFKMTVGADGSVQELEQTSAKPARVFDQEARRALLKWKFKPSFVNGKPVAAPGKRWCLEFKLEKSRR